MGNHIQKVAPSGRDMGTTWLTGGASAPPPGYAPGQEQHIGEDKRNLRLLFAIFTMYFV